MLISARIMGLMVNHHTPGTQSTAIYLYVHISKSHPVSLQLKSIVVTTNTAAQWLVPFYCSDAVLACNRLQIQQIIVIWGLSLLV